jgi:hypothetical protein
MQSKMDLNMHFRYIVVDVLGKVAFSTDFGLVKNFKAENDPKYEILNVMHAVVQGISKRLNSAPFIWSYLGVSPSDLAKQVSYVTEKVENVIESKKSELGGKRPSETKPDIQLDMLDRMIESSMIEGGFNDEELRDEVWGFFLAVINYHLFLACRDMKQRRIH